MPPRSKSGKIEWNNCSLCQLTFSSKDQSNHFTVCTEDTPVVDICKVPHGFIFGDAIHAVPQMCDGSPEQLPKHLREHSIVLNINAMKLLGLYLGGHAVVNSCLVYTTWPSQSLPWTGIGLPSSIHCELRQKKVIVEQLPVPYLTAKELIVRLRETKHFCHSFDFKNYIKRHFDGRFLTSGNVLDFTYFGQHCQIEVMMVSGCYTGCSESDVSGDIDSITQELSQVQIGQETHERELNRDNRKYQRQFYRVTCDTEVVIKDDDNRVETKNSLGQNPLSLSQLGGLEKQLAMLQELVNLLLKQSQIIKGMSLPHGVLLHGPSGTGKTLLSQVIAATSEVHCINIKGSEIWSRYYGESEARITSMFQEACDRAPCIILVDEIDVLCPRRDSSHNEVEKRVVASILTLMDTLSSNNSKVLVIATTSKRDDLDPALRRPGRFDREVEIGVPSVKERYEILTALLSSTHHSAAEEDIKDIANKAHGFVGADLAAVCKEACVRALKHTVGDECLVTIDDLIWGLQNVNPSAMREVILEIPQVSWQDIGGQKDLKHKLRQAIEWPLCHPEAFARLGIRPPRGLLMYGPPGCSKTMIAKALARDSGLNFIAIKGPELFSKWVGESERAVREVFRKARAAAPAIVFFDEIDALAGERGSGGGGGEVADRVLAQLLTEMDGVQVLKDVTIVAATNRPDRIDKALLRPGRLDRIVYVPLPDKQTRQEIFTINFRKTPIADDVVIETLVEKTERYSGAEVTAVCHEAALNAMTEDINIQKVHAHHFESALLTVTPRITNELIKFYENYALESGLHAL